MPSGKVLIVEDDPDQAAALGVHLRSSGFTVITASDAGEAVPVAAREGPNVILLDLGLPGGGGLTALARLRSMPQTARTPVLVLSGSGVDPDWAIAAGANDYFEKPADPDTVIRSIQKFIEGP
ncbi:MAG TPA: response regulator [Actinomycetota bacterium]|nr:response regulator [Actinomycetota bacterium]